MARSAAETVEMSDYLKSLREAKQARDVAKLEAAGSNNGRFPQAGLKFKYGHILATLFSYQGSILRSSSIPGSSLLPITIFKVVI